MTLFTEITSGGGGNRNNTYWCVNKNEDTHHEKTHTMKGLLTVTFCIKVFIQTVMTEGPGLLPKSFPSLDNSPFSTYYIVVNVFVPLVSMLFFLDTIVNR